MNARLIPLLLAGTAVSLSAQPPVAHHSLRAGRDLEVTLHYRAIEWRDDAEEPHALGELRTRRAMTLGEQRVEEGSYALRLAGDGVERRLVLASLLRGGPTVEVALARAGASAPSSRLRMALLPTDVAAGELDLAFGPVRATLAVAPAPRRGSTDAALVAVHEFIDQNDVDREDPEWKQKLSMPPRLPFTEGKRYLWHLRTNVGPVVVQLMPKVAPMHVSSTIYLTELGFYDGITFHRVIPRFMAQGGCPIGNGRGHPGYKYDGEYSDDVRHDRPGLLSMANAGPGTDGSQFFLTFAPAPHLDGKHTIFGEVIDGKETLDELEAAGSRSGPPRRELLIEDAWITVE